MVNRCHGRQLALKWVDAGEDSILGLIDPGVKVRGAIVALQSCTHQHKSSRMDAGLARRLIEVEGGLMPELPEVETMRRGILQVQGARITDVQRLRGTHKPITVLPKPAVFRRRAKGQTIVEVGRVGKRVVLSLSSSDVIVLEPRMTGLVLLADPPNVEHLRLQIDLDQCSVQHLWFWDRRGLGSVQLLTPDEFRQRLGPDRLGPDALQLDPELLRDRLGSSRREIKVALLDQRALAGVGNLYASEILHVAGVHPEKRCDRISRPQWQRIHQAMEGVLLEAIEHEGSTLSDGTYRNALNQSGGYQHLHRVYDRDGELCPSCESALVQRIVQCQRSTFFCPHCQTKGVRRTAVRKPR